MGKKEDNLKKLAKSTVPMSFVKKNKGEWDHEKWLAFCEEIKSKGYDPIDLDQVGLILEQKKVEFLAPKPAKKAAAKKACAKKACAKKPAAKKAVAKKTAAKKPAKKK
jgi:hypothetical protein